MPQKCHTDLKRLTSFFKEITLVISNPCGNILLTKQLFAACGNLLNRYTADNIDQNADDKIAARGQKDKRDK